MCVGFDVGYQSLGNNALDAIRAWKNAGLYFAFAVTCFPPSLKNELKKADLYFAFAVALFQFELKKKADLYFAFAAAFF